MLPGSHGEHRLQCRYGTESRAEGFYTRQVLDHLSSTMQSFIERQENLFVATSDSRGECDCTSKFGSPGFIRVLSEKHLMYPEYRGNGVFANLGNISENPHIAMLMIDFYQDTVGLHVNGRARVVENGELLERRDELPVDVLDELALEGKKRPERWVVVEVEEAYIQCSKHIPLMRKPDKRIDWGTDNTVAKGGDYFRLQEVSLYERVGGDRAMDKAVDVFYRKVLADDLVGSFFEDVDMDAQRLKQKSFLAMAFGGPYPYSGHELRHAHRRFVQDMGLGDAHFDRVIALFRESVSELRVPDQEIDAMCEVLEGFRDDILDR
ncbi:MAG: pyridoxamine 5'-phosphate oxidase family protein [Methylotetracoccus sp.]